MLVDQARIPETIWRPHRWPGRLIVIEGFDGSGKTTQIDAIGADLRRIGHTVLVTRQPTDWYRQDLTVRQYLDNPENTPSLKALALFAAADRQKHCHEVIMPALRSGAVVVCDRYVYSGIALFRFRGLPLEFMLQINEDVPRPDLAVYLSAPPEILLKRINARDQGRVKREERSVETVRQICEILKNISGDLTVVDATQDIDSVSAELKQHLRGIGL